MELISNGSVWSARALNEAGLAPVTIARAVRAGVIERVHWGAYRVHTQKDDSWAKAAKAMVRAPMGIICLESAAYLQGISDFLPSALQVAIRNDRHPPKAGCPPIEVIRWPPGILFEKGIETREVSGIAIRLTGPARTAIDLLKHPSGQSAITSMRCLREIIRRGTSFDELTDLANELAAPLHVLTQLQVIRVWEDS